MIQTILHRMAPLLSGILMLVMTSHAALAETPVGSNIDSRVLVGYRVDPAGLDPWLPEGWSPVGFPGGAFAGANLLTVFIDQRVAFDPDGRPTDPPKRRGLALVGLARETGGDQVRLYVYRLYTTDGSDPYSNSRAAEISRDSTLSGDANSNRDRTDRWTVITEGGSLEINLAFATGTPVWAPAEARPFSAANPSFGRIYRYEQLTDLVTSTPVGKPLNGSFTLTTDIPELTAIFDGRETLIGIADVPVYIRQITLP